MNNTNSPYPLLTYNFLDYFVNDNLKDKILLEIGSGESTLFWESYFKKILSYEDNLFCYNDLKYKINNKKTSLIFFNQNIFNDLSFSKNVQEADFIIIDNNPVNIDRYYFCEYVKKNKKEKCSIILDNGTWNLAAYNCLRQEFFCKDFPGINKKNQLTVTSIFDEKIHSSFFK